MTDSLVFAFGVAVTFIAVAGAYIYARGGTNMGREDVGAEPSPARSTSSDRTPRGTELAG